MPRPEPPVGAEVSEGSELLAQQKLERGGRKGGGTWKEVLGDWEDRQQALLQQHLDATREVVRECLRESQTGIEQPPTLPPPRRMSRSDMNLAPVPFSPTQRQVGRFSFVEEAKQKAEAKMHTDAQNGASALFNGTCFAGMVSGETSTGRQSRSSRTSKRQSAKVHGSLSRKGSQYAKSASFDTKKSGDPKNHQVAYKGMNESLMSVCGYAKNRSLAGMVSFAPAAHNVPHKPVPKHITAKSIRHNLWIAVHHPLFFTFSGVLVGIYTLLCGVLAHVEMKAAVKEEPPPAWRMQTDVAFTSIFMGEVLLNLFVKCTYFFTEKEWKWNIFDMIVATIGVLDVMVVQEFQLSYLRILRTLRAVRVLRMIRIFRFFKELRLMTDSILCCLASLTWAFTLLIAVMYIFSVLLLQGASDYLTHDDPTDGIRKELSKDFGDIFLAVYSLTQAVSGGRSWGEYAEPFIEISPWYGVIFTLFVVFVIFGVLNILTGIFVESTSSLALFDKDLVVQEEMSKNEAIMNQIRELFTELDENSNGTLSYHELKKNLKDERVRAYFSILQMDVSEAYGLFQLLDRDESGEVSIEEFIMSCMRLKGSAKSIDLAGMLFESKRFHTFVKQFMLSLEESMIDLRSRVQDLHEVHFVGPSEEEEGGEEALASEEPETSAE